MRTLGIVRQFKRVFSDFIVLASFERTSGKLVIYTPAGRVLKLQNWETVGRKEVCGVINEELQARQKPVLRLR